jgi:mannose-1-phosphate guanylyltransferase / mannose-6-phosphate isomerase
VSSILIQPVILCGGSGTRLWPLSRAQFPKQFISVFGAESLFQQAIDRLQRITDSEFMLAPTMMVGNEEHRFLMLDQYQAISQKPLSILLEPTGRNTAPALTLAAMAVLENGNDPVLIVSPADHLIMDMPAFTNTLKKAIRLAHTNTIVTLGVKPDRPETGYGYIRASDSIVEKFVEKPDLATAERYIEEGCYYWNSGIFVLKASLWLAALETFRPDIFSAAKKAWDGREQDAAFVRPSNIEFTQVPSESIDYAVMEACPGSQFEIKMLPLAAGWSDLGSWDAAWQSADKDNNGNAHIGDAMIVDSYNVFVHASERLVSVIGLENIVVVETADAVLVTNRAHSQNVKKIVADLDRLARQEHTQHRKVYRPWGWYDCIDEGTRFKVKRIMVKPGASLSLQKHAKRAEHWVVVSGIAEVTCGDEVKMLYENQSTYIPLGVTHRLANPGKTPLEIIEIQSGDYLKEDDIVRLEDQYGRIKND